MGDRYVRTDLCMLCCEKFGINTAKSIMTQIGKITDASKILAGKELPRPMQVRRDDE